MRVISEEEKNRKRLVTIEEQSKQELFIFTLQVAEAMEREHNLTGDELYKESWRWIFHEMELWRDEEYEDWVYEVFNDTMSMRQVMNLRTYVRK